MHGGIDRSHGCDLLERQSLCFVCSALEKFCAKYLSVRPVDECRNSVAGAGAGGFSAAAAKEERCITVDFSVTRWFDV